MVTKILSRLLVTIFSNRQYKMCEVRQHRRPHLHIANVTIIISIFSIIYNLVLQYKFLILYCRLPIMNLMI